MSRHSFSVRMDAPEISEAIARIGIYSGRMRLRVEDAIQKSTKEIGKGARRRIRRGPTGNLKKSIRTSFNKQQCAGFVKSYAPHAHLIEFGVKASTAKPKSKKAMTIDANGIRKFAKDAKIPARAANPFMKPAFEEEKPDIIREIRLAVQP